VIKLDGYAKIEGCILVLLKHVMYAVHKVLY